MGIKFFAAVINHPGCRQELHGQQAYGRSLACAIRPKQAENLATPDGERQSLQCFLPAVPAVCVLMGIFLLQILDFYHELT